MADNKFLFGGGRYRYDRATGAILKDDQSAPSWISIFRAVTHLTDLGRLQDGSHPRLLIDWAAVGLLPTRAAYRRSREVEIRDALIPREVWELCRERLWGKLDWRAGSLTLKRLQQAPVIDEEIHGIEVSHPRLVELTDVSEAKGPTGSIRTSNFDDRRMLQGKTRQALRPLSSALLRGWVQQEIEAGDAAGRAPRIDDLYDAAKARFPGNSVSRDQVRELVRAIDPSRGPGKRLSGRKRSA